MLSMKLQNQSKHHSPEHAFARRLMVWGHQTINSQLLAWSTILYHTIPCGFFVCFNFHFFFFIFGTFGTVLRIIFTFFVSYIYNGIDRLTFTYFLFINFVCRFFIKALFANENIFACFQTHMHACSLLKLRLKIEINISWIFFLLFEYCQRFFKVFLHDEKNLDLFE